MVGGKKMKTLSVTTTEAKFEINEAPSVKLSGMKLYFDIGIPSNHKLMTTGLSMVPKFTGIDVSVGSKAGTVVTATIIGVGKFTKDVSLVDSTNKAFC